MRCYDEDFYGAPSEFDMMVDEFKKTLTESVRDEYKAEMERLRVENEELQTVKRDWESIQREYAAKHRELEWERKNLESKVRGERLSALLADRKVAMWSPYRKWMQKEKCSMCNDRRRVEYTTPLGRKTSEDCTCAKHYTHYSPTESVCVGMSIDRRDGSHMSMWYRFRDEGKYDEYAERDNHYARCVYVAGMEFDSLDPDDTFFHTEQECQAYCDYLNAQEVQKR